MPSGESPRPCPAAPRPCRGGCLARGRRQNARHVPPCGSARACAAQRRWPAPHPGPRQPWHTSSMARARGAGGAPPQRLVRWLPPGDPARARSPAALPTPRLCPWTTVGPPRPPSHAAPSSRGKRHSDGPRHWHLPRRERAPAPSHRRPRLAVPTRPRGPPRCAPHGRSAEAPPPRHLRSQRLPPSPPRRRGHRRQCWVGSGARPPRAPPPVRGLRSTHPPRLG
mmetsp:Transcript_21396/g.66907  ORF Transcript_21396/g.66907 Transcript_21396/m.66907 type:complete len:224 (+) Transcript_21396:844-1515(+)